MSDKATTTTAAETSPKYPECNTGIGDEYFYDEKGAVLTNGLNGTFYFVGMVINGIFTLIFTIAYFSSRSKVLLVFLILSLLSTLWSMYKTYKARTFSWKSIPNARPCMRNKVLLT